MCRPTARPPSSRICAHDAGVDLVEQDADDDGERGVVGVAAALDLARLEAGGGHGPVDRLAAAVDEDRPQADRLHEDDVLQRGLQGVGVFHGAAAELDDRQPVAERADVAEGLDQDFGLADGVVHRRLAQGGLAPAGPALSQAPVRFEKEKIDCRRWARSVNGTRGPLESSVLLLFRPSVIFW